MHPDDDVRPTHTAPKRPAGDLPRRRPRGPRPGNIRQRGPKYRSGRASFQLRVYAG